MGPPCLQAEGEGGEWTVALVRVLRCERFAPEVMTPQGRQGRVRLHVGVGDDGEGVVENVSAGRGVQVGRNAHTEGEDGHPAAEQQRSAIATAHVHAGHAPCAPRLCSRRRAKKVDTQENLHIVVYSTFEFYVSWLVFFPTVVPVLPY